MLSSVRGGVASAMGAAAFQSVQNRGSVGRASGSMPARSSSVGPAVVVDISPAARELARVRASGATAAPATLGETRRVEMVQPRLLNLPTSTKIEDNLPLTGNRLVTEGQEKITKPTLHTSIIKGAYPLGRWTDGDLPSRVARRPGAAIERSAERARSQNSLSARLQSGEVVGGAWNEGSLVSIRESIPGKGIADLGERTRKASTLLARLGKGEESLEVGLGRHLVRPDGRGNGD